mmetsp:Transcript_3977/g.9528  ORF Transcript_3977/g.9528 Transcript_3977/m.9528 type:complete len:216 (+) Transcript_3977:1440-2087(+)
MNLRWVTSEKCHSSVSLSVPWWRLRRRRRPLQGCSPAGWSARCSRVPTTTKCAISEALGFARLSCRSRTSAWRGSSCSQLGVVCSCREPFGRWRLGETLAGGHRHRHGTRSGLCGLSCPTASLSTSGRSADPRGSSIDQTARQLGTSPGGSSWRAASAASAGERHAISNGGGLLRMIWSESLATVSSSFSAAGWYSIRRGVPLSRKALQFIPSLP